MARAEVTGEIFSDPERGIRFAAPEGWTLSQHLGYPSLLAVLTPKAPQSRIYLALVPLQGSGGDRQRSLHRTATQTATTLRPLGIEVISSRADEVAGRTAWLLTARYPVRAGQPVLVRQLYLPHGRRQALVLTLATTAARLTADLADRDYVIESLEQTAAPSTATQQQD